MCSQGPAWLPNAVCTTLLPLDVRVLAFGVGVFVQARVDHRFGFAQPRINGDLDGDDDVPLDARRFAFRLIISVMGLPSPGSLVED